MLEDYSGKIDSSKYPYIVTLSVDGGNPTVIAYFKTKTPADNYADRKNSFRGFLAKAKFNPDYVAPEYGRFL